ncbi:hypothetical protein ID866_11661 [Astraeus odoratus]|nr:hypothetical protein ID866_11661 [Astraeus odoratus]
MPITWCNDPADPAVRHRIRMEWLAEQRQYEHERRERDEQRVRWKIEEEGHAEVLREWKRERLQHEKELRERKQREIDERMRLNLSWANVEAYHCKTYATREYSAHLINLPTDYKYYLDACRETPLVIHGESYKPTRCEKHNQSVIGYWVVNQNEPECAATSWNLYKDRGCTAPGSGKRDIEYHLEDVPKGGDWGEFCATTPHHVHGMDFKGAHRCVRTIWGMYGHWEIDDESCE